jgi:plasmid stabilization system protein ParE
MKPARLSREALQEMANASSWYESKQPGLADRFMEDIENQIALVREHPSAFPVLKDTSTAEVRRALLPRFPYALVFFELSTEIRIVAVAHQKRRPGYWLHRLRL